MNLRDLVLLIAALNAGCGLLPPPAGGLVAAAREGQVDQIREFIKAGHDPNAYAGVNSWTPMEHAIHKNQLRSVIALAENGADVNQANPNGLTPLMMAAGYGYDGVVRSLLDHGAGPAVQDREGRTALDYAITGVGDIDRFTLGRCQTEVVRSLLARAPLLKPAGSNASKLAGCGDVRSAP